MEPLLFHTAAELAASVDPDDVADLHHPGALWRYDARALTLTHRDTGYEIDLEDCTTSAAVLDWICQVNRKGWCDEATLVGLVRALDRLLTPQATLCSWGRECGPINVKAVLQRRHPHAEG